MLTPFSGPVSYTVLLLLMVVEGPVVTAAAAFGARLGYFSLPVIFGLSLLGDLAGDAIYYGLGVSSRKALIERHGRKFGLDPERLERLRAALHRHKIKTLLIAKLAPVLPGPAIIAAGALRLRFRTVLWVSLLVAMPKSTLFLILGYGLGNLYVRFFRYYDLAGWIIISVLIVASYLLYRRVLKAALPKDPE